MRSHGLQPHVQACTHRLAASYFNYSIFTIQLFKLFKLFLQVYCNKSDVNRKLTINEIDNEVCSNLFTCCYKPVKCTNCDKPVAFLAVYKHFAFIFMVRLV